MTCKTIAARLPAAQMAPRVYQFHIALTDSKPLIWRRIEVPESCSFWDLHCAVSDSMGWLNQHDCHLFGYAPDSQDGPYQLGLLPGKTTIKASWTAKVCDFISSDNPLLNYMRGTPCGETMLWWPHVMRLEGMVDRQPGVEYPRCTGGRNACPPAGCQGIYGYRYFVRALNNPASKHHADAVQWIGGAFDPRHFAVAQVRFEDPALRLQLRLEGRPLSRGMRKLQYHSMLQNADK
jgi:hypothetical protein